MDYKREAEKAVAFFDAVRTAMDGAEIGVVMDWKDERAGVTLRLATYQMEVAKRNLEWAIDAVEFIARRYEAEHNNVAATDRVPTRGVVVPTKEVGRDQILERATRSRQHAP
jgi:hypothetical protein